MIKTTRNGSYNHYDFSKIKDKVTVKGAERARAGQLVTLRVEITVARPNIEKGDGLVVGVPFGVSLPQLVKPAQEGYTTFSSNSRAVLTIEHHPAKEQFLQILVRDGVLRAGEKVKLVIGDRREGSPGIRLPYQAVRDALVPCCRLLENKLSRLSPRLDIANQTYSLLRGHLTPTYRQGDGVDFTLVAEDEYGNRCPEFKGSVNLVNQALFYNPPKKITFTAKDKGCKRLSLRPRDRAELRVCCEHQGRSFVSNPCLRLDKTFPYNLYFGEIHAHCEISFDAARSLDEVYQYARDTAALHFAAAADHQTAIKNLTGYATHGASLPMFEMKDMPARWQLTCDKARQYNDPGRFVTFPGFELVPSGNPGHRNLYFLEDYPQMLKAPDGWQPWQQDILNPYLKKHKALVIPHHPAISWGSMVSKKFAGEGLVYSDVEGKHQPVVEIYSKHGSSEYFGARRPLRGQVLGHFAADFLAAGHKFGFIGGSDTHQGNPGSSLSRSGPFTTLQYRNGLAAVWARELTRESLWQAIFARRTFATSYNKSIVLFYVNDLFMGEEGVIKGPRTIRLKVLSAEKIIKVEIIKNNRVIAAENTHQPMPDFELELVDKKKSGRKEDFYYARVIETEGDIVWSSPVWVRGSI